MKMKFGSELNYEKKNLNFWLIFYFNKNENLNEILDKKTRSKSRVEKPKNSIPIKLTRKHIISLREDKLKEDLKHGTKNLNF